MPAVAVLLCLGQDHFEFKKLAPDLPAQGLWVLVDHAQQGPHGLQSFLGIEPLLFGVGPGLLGQSKLFGCLPPLRPGSC